jgi:hypothetical protein
MALRRTQETVVCHLPERWDPTAHAIVAEVALTPAQEASYVGDGLRVRLPFRPACDAAWADGSTARLTCRVGGCCW